METSLLHKLKLELQPWKKKLDYPPCNVIFPQRQNQTRMLANIEFFVFLIIAGASALFNWLQKRKEESEWQAPPPPRRPTQPPPRGPQPPVSQPKPASNWEEELRRMLEGTVPSTRNPAPPPPIVVQERKAPPPLPRQPEPPRPAPKTFQEKYYKAHCNHCGEHIEYPASATDEVIACPHCHMATVLRPFQDTRVETLAHQPQLSSLAGASQKSDAATHLSERVAAHMHGLGHKPIEATSISTHRKVSPEVTETLALFKNPRTARQAVIASLILDSPKAFEN